MERGDCGGEGLGEGVGGGADGGRVIACFVRGVGLVLYVYLQEEEEGEEGGGGECVDVLYTEL